MRTCVPFILGVGVYNVYNVSFFFLDISELINSNRYGIYFINILQTATTSIITLSQISFSQCANVVVIARKSEKENQQKHNFLFFLLSLLLFSIINRENTVYFVKFNFSLFGATLFKILYVLCCSFPLE